MGDIGLVASLGSAILFLEIHSLLIKGRSNRRQPSWRPRRSFMQSESKVGSCCSVLDPRGKDDGGALLHLLASL